MLAKNAGAVPSPTSSPSCGPQLDALQKQWPAGYSYRIGGESAETGETFASAGVALVIALVLVFGVLVIMFDSFAQAFILIATVPFALTGTFLAFPALGMSFSFFAMVGVIALIGIVVNDGIVMVDTMNQHLQAGDDIADGVGEGRGRAAAADPDHLGDDDRRPDPAGDRQPDVPAAVLRDHLRPVLGDPDLALRHSGAVPAPDAKRSPRGREPRLSPAVIGPRCHWRTLDITTHHKTTRTDPCRPHSQAGHDDWRGLRHRSSRNLQHSRGVKGGVALWLGPAGKGR